jgi:ABC-type multidrug transport system fused ATPase/permease subunit
VIRATYTNAALVRRLLLLAWRYRRGCVAVLLYQLVLLALGLTGLGLTGLAIDVLRRHLQPSAPAPRWPLGWQPGDGLGPLALVAAVGGMVLLMATARALLNYRYTIAVARLVQGEIVPEMRASVFEKLQRMSFRFFDATASGSIMNRVTGDVQSVRAFVDQVLIQSVILLLSLGVYLVYMLKKDVTLTLVCVASTPLLWLATTVFSRRVQPAYENNRQLQDRLTTFFTETVQGIRVVKGFSREPERLAGFRERNNELLQQQRGIFRRVSLFSPTIDLLSQLNVVVLLAYGGWLAVQGRITLGDLIVFAGLLQQFAGQVANLANIANTLQQSLIAARRVFDILDAPLEVQSLPSAARARLQGALRFENVTFAYGAGAPALADVDFQVPPGARVVLFGETGAGKTTLLALVARFYDPQAGRVWLDDQDVRSLDLDDLRAQVGVVFQESFLFSARVADNLAFGRPDATRAQIEAAARLACAHDFISALPDGYDTVLDEGGANLSGGQRQRLAIARAILRDPPLLLLDDPTAAVDAQTEGEVLAALDGVAVRRTTIIATHRLAACRSADLILVLDRGRIVERGRHDELLALGGRYAAAAAVEAGETPTPQQVAS